MAKTENKSKPATKKQGFVQFGKTWFNFDALTEMTEEQAIKMHKHLVKGRVINAWKQANKKK